MEKYCLSGKFKGEIYDRAFVANSEIFDDFLIFDISDGCRIVARRHGLSSAADETCVYEMMSENGARELRQYLFSYDMRPMLVNTSRGMAAVIPSLAPSSALGALIFMKMEAKKVYSCAKKTPAEILISEELSNLSGTARVRPMDVGECELAVSRIYDAFYCPDNVSEICGDVTAAIEQSIYAASIYTACPVFVACSAPAVCVAGLDLPMLKAFLVITLSCALSVSLRGMATVSIESNDYGVSVRVSIEMKKGKKMPAEAIESLSRLADRNRMVFEFMEDSVVTHVRFSPMRSEWSLLDIKAPSYAEDTDSEKTV